jgi:hypothetical protein
MACALAAFAAAPALAQAPAAGGPLAGFGWFAELAGSCWKGDHPDGKTSDTQCYLAQYERLMRGSIKATRDATQTVFEGDAVFAVDPGEGKRVVYTQWGYGGVYTTGEITFEGDTLVFRNRQLDGTQSSVRSIWRRTGADGFRVTRERKDDSGWKEFLTVDYRRVR